MVYFEIGLCDRMKRKNADFTCDDVLGRGRYTRRGPKDLSLLSCFSLLAIL